MRLKDKVAIITGGGQGIGEAITLGFAKEGADTVIADINLENAQRTAKKVEELGRRAMAIEVDVSKSSHVDTMVEATVNKFGRIDILVNNAGINILAPLLEYGEEQWDRVIAVNLKGVFLCTQRVARQMVKQEIKGKIINISSIGGKVGYPCRPAYGASKGGVINFTQAAASELCRYGIWVNSIAPGPTDTPMHDDITYTQGGPQELENLRNIVRTPPVGRRGKPEDIAAAAIYLASDESDYVLGTILDVDGGFLGVRTR